MAGYIGSKAVITSGVSASIDELNIIDGVTATTAELNILDGVTSTAAELNILDGVTSTAAELNILDGVTATATELNLIDGVTATTAELNILDGVTATAAEINLIDGGTARGTTAIVDADGLLVNDAGTMRMTTMGTLATYINTKVGAPAVVFPTIGSPDNTYTSSATWSKGSLGDDDFVWLYLVGGGAGGKARSNNLSPSSGGPAILLYGQAKFFNGGAFVVGAGTAGGDSTTAPAFGAASTFTLTSTYGAGVFSTDAAREYNGGANHSDPSATLFNTISGVAVKQGTTNIQAAPPRTHNFILGVPITGWTGDTDGPMFWNFGQVGSTGKAPNGIFGGGAGGSNQSGGGLAGGGSLFAGNGGAGSGDGSGANGTAGTVPGGGGGAGGQGNGTGGAGANGNVRDYYV